MTARARTAVRLGLDFWGLLSLWCQAEMEKNPSGLDLGRIQEGNLMEADKVGQA